MYNCISPRLLKAFILPTLLFSTMVSPVLAGSNSPNYALEGESFHGGTETNSASSNYSARFNEGLFFLGTTSSTAPSPSSSGSSSSSSNSTSSTISNTVAAQTNQITSLLKKSAQKLKFPTETANTINPNNSPVPQSAKTNPSPILTVNQDRLKTIIVISLIIFLLLVLFLLAKKLLHKLS